MSLYDRVIIAGGGGMLASALARSLRARSIQPILFDRAALDITSPEAPAIIEQHQPTLVVNCAAYTKVDLCQTNQRDAMRTNGLAAGVLAHVARRIGALFVHFSSDFVFDGKCDRPYRPDDEAQPLSVYGESKLIGEQLVERTGGRRLIVRTSWLYGPGGANFVQTMLGAARAGKKLSVVNDQVGSPTFTHDLADATLELIDREARGIYHVTNSGQTSWFGFAQAIFDEFGLSPDLSPTTSAAWKAAHPLSAIRPAYSVLDCGATEELLRRSLPTWRDALHRYRLAVE